MIVAVLVRAAALLALTLPCYAATLGTVVTDTRAIGAADLVLDEARNRIYLVIPALDRIEVYSIAQRRFLNSIPTDRQPLAATLSRDGRHLYVAAHTASSLQVFDLDTLSAVARVSLRARPEGVAVGADGRVLISTIGTGQNNQTDILLIYNPSPDARTSLESVSIAPPPPQSPLLPPPAGRVFLTNRSRLEASADGRFIIGVNIPTATTRSVFVFETASGTVLRSRTITNASSVLAVSPDGSRFMAGLTLFETSTLQMMAQQNTANAPFPYATGINFNLQQTQGGSVFSPDGGTLYSAFNTAPVQTPPARANVSQLLVNDPENLLIRSGLQLPENLVGRMAIAGNGGTIYALSESGFMIIPVGAARNNPLAEPERTTSLLVNDQCGAFAERRTGTLRVNNAGGGRMSVNVQLLQQTPTGPVGIGGVGGPGGGAPGGGVVIVLPGAPGNVTVPMPPTLPGGVTTPTNAAVAATAPQFRARTIGEVAELDMTFSNSATLRSGGTLAPHTLLVQSNEAVNIPPAVKVYQNFRDAESRGEIVPIETGLSANEGLEDLVFDESRQRIYLANSGKNRVEVFDILRGELLPPVKVGQLPRSLALTPDGATLYVANSGGESISIVDPDRLRVTGHVRFPPLPFNSGAAPMTPSLIAAGVRGPLVMMNNGTVWSLVGDEAVPRQLPAEAGTQTIPAPRTMAASADGSFVLILGGNGVAHLYDANNDAFLTSRQVFGTVQGYYGPIGAGPRGQFFLLNGEVLNSALTSTGSATLPGSATNRLVSAVAVGPGGTFARLVQPVRANANTLPTEKPVLEVVEAASGRVVRSATALEGPVSTLVGNARLNVNGRTLVLDGSGLNAYAITTSGLSVIPLTPSATEDRPIVNPNGAVSLVSYTAAFAPGSLISIFGRKLAGDGAISSSPSPSILGGVCLTINNQALPLLMTSEGQINAQIPTELAAGRHSLIVRAVDRKIVSAPQNLTVTRYAPAIFTDAASRTALVFRDDGSLVTRDRPAKRDERLTLYGSGFGATSPRLPSGVAAPSSPLAETEPIELFVGDPRYRQAEVIVDWAGLAPGYVGLYQVNFRIPGDHIRGEAVPVLLRIGGAESQKTGPVVPTLPVD